MFLFIILLHHKYSFTINMLKKIGRSKAYLIFSTFFHSSCKYICSLPFFSYIIPLTNHSVNMLESELAGCLLPFQCLVSLLDNECQ